MQPSSAMQNKLAKFNSALANMKRAPADEFGIGGGTQKVTEAFTDLFFPNLDNSTRSTSPTIATSPAMNSNSTLSGGPNSDMSIERGGGGIMSIEEKLSAELLKVIITSSNYYMIGMYFMIKYCIRVP